MGSFSCLIEGFVGCDNASDVFYVSRLRMEESLCALQWLDLVQMSPELIFTSVADRISMSVAVVARQTQAAVPKTSIARNPVRDTALRQNSILSVG